MDFVFSVIVIKVKLYDPEILKSKMFAGVVVNTANPVKLAINSTPPVIFKALALESNFVIGLEAVILADIDKL